MPPGADTSCIGYIYIYILAHLEKHLLAKTRRKRAKRRPKIVKIRRKRAEMRPKMAKRRPKLAKMRTIRLRH